MTDEKQPKKKSAAKEWWSAIKFAVIFATIFKWGLLGATTVPTPSMEGTIMVGDYLWVSKFHFGALTPITPLQVPLTHQKLPGTGINSYLDWIKLPQFRLPGLRDLERLEPVVFHYPAETELPIDIRTYYVKRCVGAPGDELSFVQGDLTINGEIMDRARLMQQQYLIQTDQVINARTFKKWDISEHYQVNGGYLVFAKPNRVDEIKQAQFVADVIQILGEETDPQIWYGQSELGWNADNFGPLWIPKEGETLELTADLAKKYFPTIRDHEYPDEEDVVVIENDVIKVNGAAITSHTFKQDYYFMAGDNRNNSLDSRYWGFVPENHIVGKPLFVLVSWDSNGSGLDKIRWDHSLSMIK